MTRPRLIAAILAVGSSLASCTVLFDYGEDPAAGTGGAGGEVTTCGAPTDCDDQNDCTTDDCSAAGLCVNSPVPDGSACRNGGGQDGICEGGACLVSCTAADPTVCDDDNRCTVDSCDTDAGQCVNAAVPDGPLVEQTVGDCKVVTCTNGLLVTENDDSDPFDDSNDCTDDVCNAGVPGNPPLPAGTSCGEGLVCGEDGTCVGCNTPADCSGSNTFCQTVTCNGSVCGLAFTAAGTPLPSQDQIPNDCKEIQCDGAGGQQTVNETAGTACNDGLFCNGADSCLSGNCSQHGADPCAAQLGDGDTDCTEACNESNDTCTANDPIGASCTDGVFCNGMDACDGSGSCSQHQGDPCAPVIGGSCFSSCNETQDNCSALDPFQTPCAPNGCCTNSGNCNTCF